MPLRIPEKPTPLRQRVARLIVIVAGNSALVIDARCHTGSQIPKMQISAIEERIPLKGFGTRTAAFFPTHKCRVY